MLILMRPVGGKTHLIKAQLLFLVPEGSFIKALNIRAVSTKRIILSLLDFFLLNYFQHQQ